MILPNKIIHKASAHLGTVQDRVCIYGIYLGWFNHSFELPIQLALNFQPLEVVSRYRDPQLQVTENYVDFFCIIHWLTL